MGSASIRVVTRDILENTSISCILARSCHTEGAGDAWARDIITVAYIVGVHYATLDEAGLMRAQWGTLAGVGLRIAFGHRARISRALSRCVLASTSGRIAFDILACLRSTLNIDMSADIISVTVIKNAFITHIAQASRCSLVSINAFSGKPSRICSASSDKAGALVSSIIAIYCATIILAIRDSSMIAGMGNS